MNTFENYLKNNNTCDKFAIRIIQDLTEEGIEISIGIHEFSRYKDKIYGTKHFIVKGNEIKEK